MLLRLVRITAIPALLGVVTPLVYVTRAVSATGTAAIPVISTLTPAAASPARALALRSTMASGSHYIKAFNTYIYSIKTKNVGTTVANKPSVVIDGLDSPLDFKSIAIEGEPHGFRCEIRQAMAIFKARAVCWTDDPMAPGIEVVIRLRTSTGPVVPGQGELRVTTQQVANSTFETLHVASWNLYIVW